MPPAQSLELSRAAARIPQTSFDTSIKCWIFERPRDVVREQEPTHGTRAMGIAEMQQHFNAYGSGQLPEFELRTFIRNALRQEPQLSSAFIALTDAYRRANLIDPKLQSTINADITEVTSPLMGLTMVRPVEATSPMVGLTMVRSPAAQRSNAGWISDVSAANSTDVNTGPSLGLGPAAAIGRTGPTGLPNGSATGPGTSPPSGTTAGSAWDVCEGLAEVAAPLYPGAVLRDRFVLVEELGRGGMGVVYKAYDRSRGDVKDRYVAIKVLSEEFKRHPLAVRALQRETRKAQRLAHPNVVAVHDFDRDGGNVYMVMEYLSGRSLDQVLRDDGQGGIPLGPAMQIIQSLGAALSYAHQQDIVHCDFKPSNAFLTHDGKVKVLDFGIARAAPSLAEKGDTTMFDAGQLGAISPTYASFELLQREQPDVRDDVYSFACVAYELLTGCHPYQRLDALRAYQTGLEPRPIGKLSRGQWRALKQGLAFRRADRYPTVDALARDLMIPESKAKTWAIAAAVGAAVTALAGAGVWKWPDVQRVVLQPFTTSHHVEQARNATPDHQAPPTDATTPATADPARTAVPSDNQPNVEASRPNARAGSTTAPQPSTARATSARATTAGSPSSAGSPTTAGSTTSASSPTSAGGSPTSAGGSPTSAGSPGASTRAPAAPSSAGSTISPSPTASPTSSQPSTTQPQPNGEEKNRAAVEMLREQFETQAAAGDIQAATNTARALTRASPGSQYVTHEIPRILALSYSHLAKNQFTAGQVGIALQTLADGRKKFTKSTDLKDLEEHYVAAANIYDRLSTAVVLNVNDMKSSLDELKNNVGDDFDATAQMLAQTLADRIADHRAANRSTVADKLLDSGKQVFPGYTGILAHGTPGVLQNTPLPVNTE